MPPNFISQVFRYARPHVDGVLFMVDLVDHSGFVDTGEHPTLGIGKPRIDRHQRPVELVFDGSKEQRQALPGERLHRNRTVE
jgi:hypothetical protein